MSTASLSCANGCANFRLCRLGDLQCRDRSTIRSSIGKYDPDRVDLHNSPHSSEDAQTLISRCLPLPLFWSAATGSLPSLACVMNGSSRSAKVSPPFSFSLCCCRSFPYQEERFKNTEEETRRFIASGIDHLQNPWRYISRPPCAKAAELPFLTHTGTVFLLL